jgi:hypothetical protein
MNHKIQSEDIVQQLLEFVSNNGRLPEHNEPGYENLIQEAVKTFGTLENALRVAGLLINSTQTLPIRNTKSIIVKPKAARLVSQYPPDYFLEVLELKRPQHYGPAPDGTPTWWERKANSAYICSACKQSIEKGERYLGRKKLRPGQRGAYGYRGTYVTEYYHIVCLLKDARTNVNGNIQRCTIGINSNQREIDTFRIEVSSRIGQIDNCRRIILQTEEEFQRTRGVLERVGKWFRNKYISWSENREIGRLRDRVSIIENIEIPKRKGNINDLSRKKADLQLRLNQLDDKIRELS